MYSIIKSILTAFFEDDAKEEEMSGGISVCGC